MSSRSNWDLFPTVIAILVIIGCSCYYYKRTNINSVKSNQNQEQDTNVSKQSIAQTKTPVEINNHSSEATETNIPQKQEKSSICTIINETDDTHTDSEWLATLQIDDPLYVYTKAYTGASSFERIYTAAGTYGWREARIVAMYKDKVEFTLKKLHSWETGDSGTFYMDKNRKKDYIVKPFNTESFHTYSQHTPVFENMHYDMNLKCYGLGYGMEEICCDCSKIFCKTCALLANDEFSLESQERSYICQSCHETRLYNQFVKALTTAVDDVYGDLITLEIYIINTIADYGLYGAVVECYICYNDVCFRNEFDVINMVDVDGNQIDQRLVTRARVPTQEERNERKKMNAMFNDCESTDDDDSEDEGIQEGVIYDKYEKILCVKCCKLKKAEDRLKRERMFYSYS